MMMEVLILAGGSGTRLWPLSRKYLPKQFLKLPFLNDLSLFQITIKRALKITELENVYIVTNESLKFLVKNQLSELGFKLNKNNIIIEPEAKNTLPAIMLGVEKLKDKILVMSSDHLILEEDLFFKTLNLAEKSSLTSLVLFGIKPNKPKTGYGYINYDKNNKSLIEFKEKPDENLAKTYIDKGYLWNSGIFLFTKSVFLKEIKKTNLKYYDLLVNNKVKLNFNDLENTSIDFALLEKTKNIKVFPLNITWSDLGTFDSIFDSFEKDKLNNLVTDNVFLLNSKNNLVLSDRKKHISLIDVEDLNVIDTSDALLIVKKNNSEKIKAVVNNLKQLKDTKIDFHSFIQKSWGKINTLEKNLKSRVDKLKILSKSKFTLRNNTTINKRIITILKGEVELIFNDGKHKLSVAQTYILEKKDVCIIFNNLKTDVELIITNFYK